MSQYNQCRPVSIGRVLLLSVAALAWRAPLALGQFDAPRPQAAVEGYAIEADQLQRDASGRPTLGDLPGVRAARPVDPAHQQDLEALKAERDQVVGSARAARRKIVPPDPPSDALAPTRMDSGDPDPDRVQAGSRPTF